MNIRINTLWNLFGSVTPLVVGVAAIPYIYGHIGVERTGLLTIIWALIGYFSIFDFGLGRAITQRIASVHSHHEKKGRTPHIASTGVLLTLLIGVVGAVTGLSCIQYVGLDWLNTNPQLKTEVTWAFVLACIAVPATTMTAGAKGVMEGKEEFKIINILKMLLGIANFAGPVVSIYWFGPRLDYIVATLVMTRIFVLGAHMGFVKKDILHLRNDFQKEEAKKLFKFGGWMTLSNIISPLMVVADRFIIAHVLGASIVAFYTIPAEFMLRLLIIPAALTTTLFPVFAKSVTANKTNAKEMYWRYAKKIVFAMGLICVTIALAAEHIFTLWLGNDFAQESSKVASILALGIFFNSTAQIPHAFVQAAGDAQSTAWLHLLEALVYIPALLLVLPSQGIVGAAWVWSMRALVDLLSLHLLATRRMP